MGELIPGDPRPGRRWFGVHDRLGKNLGTCRLDVRVQGDGFEVELRCEYTLEKQRVLLEEALALGPRLELRRAQQRIREGEQERVLRYTRTKPGLWRGLDGGPAAYEVQPPHSPLLGVAQRLLLAELARPAARALAMSELGPHDDALGARWLRARAAEPAAEGRPARPERVELGEGAREPKPGQRIRGGVWTFLRREGRLLEVEPAGFQGMLLRAAADEAEAKRDRPVVPPDSARAAVLQFLLAVARGEPEQAKAVVDWPALQRSLGEGGTPEAFQARLLQRLLRASGELDVEGVERLARDLREDEGSPRRAVEVPGEKLRFLLEKGPAGWRIVDLD
ncbi:MAG: hypothetical protein AB7N76_00865 [Planctomycetota bacterium]